MPGTIPVFVGQLERNSKENPPVIRRENPHWDLRSPPFITGGYPTYNVGPRMECLLVYGGF